MTSYKGLYVQRLEDGGIFGVQVVDPHGNSLSLNQSDYIQRLIKPSIEELPEEKEYKLAEKKISALVLELVEWVKGNQLTEDGVQRMRQFGFIYSDNGPLKLTLHGRDILIQNGFSYLINT